MTGEGVPIRSIVHVITGLGTGGAETMLARLATRRVLAERQVVVSLLPGGPLRARLEEAGVPVIDLGMGRLPDPQGVWRLRRLLLEERPNVVQGWMYHGDLLAALALALLPAESRPVLCWGVRCSDMDFGRYGASLRAVVGLCKRLSKRPDAVVANSYAGREAHETLGYRPRRFEVIWNGLDEECYSPNPGLRAALRREFGLPNNAPVFAHVARVDPMKDHAGFLEALNTVGNAHALLVGLGTDHLPSHPRALALGRRDDVPRLLAAADAIVCSSAFGEGFPNAIAEGMLSGCIPISTEVGDTRTMIADTGHVVPRRDPAALAAAMKTVVGMDPAARKAAQEAARARAITAFGLTTCERAFLNLYRSLLSSRGRS